MSHFSILLKKDQEYGLGDPIAWSKARRLWERRTELSKVHFVDSSKVFAVASN
jgi:hypothetical protein